MQPLAQAASAAPPPVAAPPNTPTSVTLAGASGGLTVAWQAGAVDATHGAATAFNLRYSLSGAGAWTTVSAVASPYTVVGLASGVAFDVQVQAANSVGASGWSATVTLATAFAAPNAPAAPTLAQGASSDLIVTWLPSAVDATHSAAATYNIEYSVSGAGAWTVVTGVASPYDLSGLAGITAYDVLVQASNTGGVSGWSPAATLTTGAVVTLAPNAPVIAGVAPLPDGTASKLAVTWPAPAADSSHNAATGYNLRYGPSGSGSWTVVAGVSSPYTITGLSGASAIDVQVQATNAAASPGAWSTTVTGTTWGATVVPGTWVAATTQVHNTSVMPSGGVNITATPAPTAVASAVFAWSASASAIPTTNLITTTADGQTNGWGQWFNAPATAGTYYLWMLAQDSGGNTVGALVTSAITVT